MSRTDATGLQCPACGSDAIQGEHFDGAIGSIGYFCLCCGDRDGNETKRHFKTKNAPSHIHDEKCGYVGWRSEKVQPVIVQGKGRFA